MRWVVAVGGPGPVLSPSWDFSLPVYMLLSFLLIVFLVRARITAWAGIACFVAGTLWAWLENAIGVIPAGAVAVLVAETSGAVRRRMATDGRPR